MRACRLGRWNQSHRRLGRRAGCDNRLTGAGPVCLDGLAGGCSACGNNGCPARWSARCNDRWLACLCWRSNQWAIAAEITSAWLGHMQTDKTAVCSARGEPNTGRVCGVECRGKPGRYLPRDSGMTWAGESAYFLVLTDIRRFGVNKPNCIGRNAEDGENWWALWLTS